MDPQERMFHIGDVLSITTGRLVSPSGIDGICDILNFMTMDNLMTHQIPRACEECRPYLFAQYPWLESPEITTMAIGELILMLKETETGKMEKKLLVMGWLSKLISGKYSIQCPEMLAVRPIPESAHEVRDPVEELEEKLGKDRVIVVQVP